MAISKIWKTVKLIGDPAPRVQVDRCRAVHTTPSIKNFEKPATVKSFSLDIFTFTFFFSIFHLSYIFSSRPRPHHSPMYFLFASLPLAFAPALFWDFPVDRTVFYPGDLKYRGVYSWPNRCRSPGSLTRVRSGIGARESGIPRC